MGRRTDGSLRHFGSAHQLCTKSRRFKKTAYDKHASKKHHSTLEKGQSVQIQKPGHRTWSRAIVLEHDKSPNSYWVQTQDCRVYRRNRRHIMPILTPPIIPQRPLPDDVLLSTPVPDTAMSSTQPVVEQEPLPQSSNPTIMEDPAPAPIPSEPTPEPQHTLRRSSRVPRVPDRYSDSNYSRS